MQGLEFTKVALPAGQPLTSRLGSVARHCGGQADLFDSAQLYTRWMQVPATEAVKARLAAMLEARPGSDKQELARMARKIAATRI